jgi:1-acyl-sn-glycerol-3-phosphate acyltransferase
MARLLHEARAIVVPVRVGGFRRLLFFKQLPGRLFRRCRISVRRPMDLTAFYDAPFTEEAGEEVRLRVENEIYGRTMKSSELPAN